MQHAVTRVALRTPEKTYECWCFANPLSQALFRETVTGRVYPRVDFVTDVRVVLDVGANVGAAALCFARRYPEALVHAVEPGAEAFELLLRNAAHFPNIRTHRLGLYSEDRSAPLYQSQVDGVTASVGRSDFNTSEAEPITMRRADRWVAEQGLARIDILKLDTEGCEVPILESLAAWLPAIPVIYVEYHSEDDRLRIDELLRATHILVDGRIVHLHRGEFLYVAKSAFPSREALDFRKIVVSL